MKKELNITELEPVLKDIMSLSFAYLDKAIKELQDMDLKDLDKADKAKQQKFNLLHTAISAGLDLTHRSYPICYDIFPENKDNLDNAYKMFKRFEAAKLLKNCPCNYCKDNPVEVATTLEEMKADAEYLEKEKKDWESKFEEALAEVKDKSSEEADAVRAKFKKEFDELSKRLSQRFPEKSEAAPEADKVPSAPVADKKVIKE